MQKLAARLRADFADFEPAEAEQLTNINTPQELRAARRRRAPQKSR
jgi:molybdopterin-guanine dinucleotide biosynthesis protein A